MSGRLILLPKKSYTPWNPENVERVLRDERLERERLEKKQKISNRDASKHRIDTLKRQKRQSLSDTNEYLEQDKHFNLFEKEEEQMLEQISIPKTNETNNNSSYKYKNETRVYLNHYSMNSRTNRKHPISEQSEEKIKQRMDPMNLVYSNEIPPSYGSNIPKPILKINHEKIISLKIQNQGEYRNITSKTQCPKMEEIKQSQVEPKHSNTNSSVSLESCTGIKKRHHSDRHNQHKKRKRKSHKHQSHHRLKKKRKQKQNTHSDISNDDCYDSCSSSSSILYDKYRRRQRHCYKRHKQYKHKKY